jgi:hypothetical protein
MFHIVTIPAPIKYPSGQAPYSPSPLPYKAPPSVHMMQTHSAAVHPSAAPVHPTANHTSAPVVTQATHFATGPIVGTSIFF